MSPRSAAEDCEETPDFLQPWSRAVLMFLVLSIGFVLFRLWLVLFPEE
jgi:hypothetical protein